jgi:hypothetical protein
MAGTVNTLGGTWTDLEGNPLASGYLLFEINQGATVTGTEIFVVPGKVIKILLNVSGEIVSGQSLWPNDVLTPANSNNQNNVSFYTVTAYTQAGQRVWGPYCQTVLSSPSPFVTNAWIPGQLTT